MTRVSQPRPPLLQGVSQAQSSKGKGHQHSVKQQPMPSSSGGQSFAASTIQPSMCECMRVCVNLYILYCPSILSLSPPLSQVERLKLLLSVRM